MMRNGGHYSVAVRKQDGDIAVKTEEYKGVVQNRFLTKTPFIRGVFCFIDSLVLGMTRRRKRAEARSGQAIGPRRSVRIISLRDA